MITVVFFIMIPSRKHKFEKPYTGKILQAAGIISRTKNVNPDKTGKA